MSKPIEYIEICGFRGVLAPLRLEFKRGKTRRSMMIYGSNGTGKSSITDALEWLQTGRIKRLACEGAKERSYAHRSATENPYVRAMVADPALDVVGLTHRLDKVTIPDAKGRLEDLRKSAPHPWQVRSEDLAEFVFMTKSERFDALSRLMGFGAQVEYQKGLRRVEKGIQERRDQAARTADAAEDRLKELTGFSEISESAIVKALQKKLSPLDEKLDHLRQAPAVRDRLAREIEADPTTNKLSRLRTILTRTDGDVDSAPLEAALEVLRAAAGKMLGLLQDNGADLFRIELLEAGLEVLSKAGFESGEPCPLCGEPYGGDLQEHVEEELQQLTRLKSAVFETEAALESVDQLRKGLHGRAVALRDLQEDAETVGLETAFSDLKLALTSTTESCAVVEALDSRTPSRWRKQHLEEVDAVRTRMASAVTDVNCKRESLRKAAADLEKGLATEKRAGALIEARDLIRDAMAAYKQLSDSRERREALSTVCEEFTYLVENYVEASIDDVETTFGKISGDVAKYFHSLESTTEGLGNPALKLLRDQDRAVILEIEFRGDRIDGAHGYLSLSQLNSFGLAVFLAAAKSMNADFPFLVLDDVINSFDSYKRPRLARLLADEFGDFQMMVFTHDDILADRLATECPSWIRLRFARYELGSGPVLSEDRSTIETIETLIADDRATMAGRSLGPLLERELQEVAEAFKALVPYNRRNEYTLDPLLDRVRVRVKDKLGSKHDLHVALKTLQESTGFRNFCAHWKDPASNITREEVQEVLNQWRTAICLMRCDRSSGCGRLARYDQSNQAFACDCKDVFLT